MPEPQKDARTSMPRVAVIIPCFNVERYVTEAVNSIRSQTYENLSIICLDDGSTDSTFELLEEISKKDNRIVLLQNDRNRGLIFTLNRLIHLADAEILIRMDPDDISAPRRVSSLVAAHLQSGADVVTSRYRYIDSESRFSGHPILSLPRNFAALQFVSLFNSPIPHAPCLYTKKFICTFGYSNDWVAAEDYDLWVRAIEGRTYRFQCDPRELYSYRIYAASESNARRWTQARNHVKISRRARRFLLGENTRNWAVIYSQFHSKFHVKQSLWIIHRAIDDVIQSFFYFRNRHPLTKVELHEIRQYAFELLLFIAFTYIRKTGLRGVSQLLQVFSKPSRFFFILGSLRVMPRMLRGAVRHFWVFSRF